MDIQVKNAVTTIEFAYQVIDSHWTIKVNGLTLKDWSAEFGRGYDYRTLKYYSLDDAVNTSKKRGLLPKDFNAEDLKQNTKVTITS